MKAKLSTLLVVLISLGLGTTACNRQAEENNQKQTILWYEMMEIHDEVMPKTSEINRLSRNLKGMKEEVPEIYESQYNLALQNLEIAEEGMMTWMSELKPLDQLRKATEHGDIMNYLTEEKGKITEVKKNMLSSIGNAELLKVRMTQHNKRSKE